MTRTINDVIILGRAVPERISDGRVTVCVAGYSPELGFVRLYPTRVDSPLNVWNIVSVEVERNPQDSRLESWKFVDSHIDYQGLNQHIEIRGEMPRHQRLEWIDSLRSGCVSEINERHLSLGIIKPKIQKYYLANNQMHRDAFQPLFDFIEHAKVETKRDYNFEPRIQYTCGDDCLMTTHHDQQLLDWGCYLWMKKNPGKEGQIWRNLHFGESDYQHYFLVGNQAHQRTSFMVINVIRQKAPMLQTSLFPMPPLARHDSLVS